MDLMATTASVQCVPLGQPGGGNALPFYSRYSTAGSAGVDVLSRNVRLMPDNSTECFGFCFPPVNMVGVVLQHFEETRAHAVVVVPDQRRSWYTRLAGAIVRSREVARAGDDAQFFSTHHQRGREPFRFVDWAMRAVEVNFGTTQEDT